ncbi:MAG: LarC family nickel insertion protein [Candidatus Altiarchaeota archaeon]
MIYLDCSSGVSGDMFAGALLGMGADIRKIRKALKPIAEVSSRKVRKRGAAAVKFDVKFNPKSRAYADLVRSVKKLKLKSGVESLVLRILGILAQAESKAHGITLSRVHLHEAADCVVDAVASGLALDELNLLDEVFVSSTVSCGFLAEATKQIIREYGIPVKFVSDRELLTPTGAAIIAAVVSEYKSAEYIECGSGAGTMDLPWPNVLRVARIHSKVVLESNVDDCTPEHISYMMSSLMGAGALDVHVLPCVMKKGRIGFLVRVLTERPKEHAEIIMEETGSLGVRVVPVSSRFELSRKMRNVRVKFPNGSSKIRVKYTPLGYKPEFDDLASAARKNGLTFREARERTDSTVKAATSIPALI